MSNYQTLRNLSTIWTLVSFVIGLLIGLAGAITLFREGITGAAYIIAGILIVLIGQTLSEGLLLLVDAAIYLRDISEAFEPEPEPKQTSKPSIQKLSKG